MTSIMEAVAKCQFLAPNELLQLATAVTNTQGECRTITRAIAQRSLVIGLNNFSDADLDKLASICGLVPPYSVSGLQATLHHLSTEEPEEYDAEDSDNDLDDSQYDPDL